jgi:starch phosphorylase
MLKEYTLGHYEPAAARSADMVADHFERAKAFVRWRRLVFRGWPSVAVMSTGFEELASATGSRYRVSAQVTLGDLDPTDVSVQLVHGAVEPDDELSDPTFAAMHESGAADVPGWHRFEHELDFDRSGNFGFTVRIVPSHPDLLNPAYLARVAWAPSPFTPPPAPQG